MKSEVSFLRASFTALVTLSWVTSALAQTLTTPPNQSPPPGSNFSSVNSNVVTANAGGTITLTGGTVTLGASSGGQLAGLLATGDQATINATNVNIANNNLQGSSITFGVNAISTPTGAATVTLDGGTIVTSALTGGRAYGINSAVGGTVNATGVTIETLGKSSHGVVGAGGTIHLINGSVITSGQSAIGLQANGNAGPVVITADGTKVMTSGLFAFGMTVDGANPSMISLKNVALSTAGVGAAGLAILGSPPLNTTSQITLDNTIVNNSQADGIDWVAQSNADVTLKNRTTINPGNGTLLDVFRPAPSSPVGTLNLNADGNVILNGNILANVLVNEKAILNVNLSNNSVLTGAIQDATNVSIESGSTWNITDTSTVTGNVSLNQGMLAFQSGVKFASTGEASVLNIGGNYTMHSTLSLGIGGINGEQYDHVQVGGNASVNGTLDVSSLGGFHPSNGDAFLILRSNGTRTGNFSLLDDSAFNNNPNLQPQLRPVAVEVVAPNGIVLTYLTGVTPGPSPPKPKPPIIDVIPMPIPPVGPEDRVPLSFLLAALSPTAEQLSSMFEISFSGANMERFNLTDRMLQIRQGSTGYVSPLPTPAPPVGKETVFQKEGKAPAPVFQPVPTNRWGVWVNGWGDWVSVDDDNGIKGYDFTTGGVSVGVDYRITDCLAIGGFGSYSHTWTDLQPGNIDVDTGLGGLYATYWRGGFYVNGGIYGGGNSYDSHRQVLGGGFANGSTDGYLFSTFVDTGYNFAFGNLSFGPVFAAQYTNVHIDGFTESASLLPLNIHEDSEESWKTDLGIQAYYTWHVGHISVIPSLWAAWEHEYKTSKLPVTFSSVNFPGTSATVFGPDLGHDSAIINAGVGVQWTPRISTYVGYRGELGRTNYESNAVTGTISFSF